MAAVAGGPEGNPFNEAQRRELDHLREKLELQMENLKQERETAYERLIGEVEKLRTDNAEMKSELQSQQIRTISVILGGVAVLLALFGLILRAGV